MKSQIEHLRHSLAHLLAAAVLELYPGSKLAIGPAIDNGFYYDIDIMGKISDDDLPKIEAKMRELAKSWEVFEKIDVTPNEAKKIFKDNPFKVELIEEFEKNNQPITLYYSGPRKTIPDKQKILNSKFQILDSGFLDLCRGGHVNSASELNSEAFTLTHTAGAYWRPGEGSPGSPHTAGAYWQGDEKNKMLTIIY
ncbi:MAG: hypothetical protein AAB799_00110 [Patescibacteria group bacterium]